MKLDRFFGALLLCGCVSATPPPYQIWIDQLNRAHHGPKTSVSLFLGVPPHTCDDHTPKENLIGLNFDDNLRVTAMPHRAPAHNAGIKLGEKILTVGEKSVTSFQECYDQLITLNARGEPYELTTDRGGYTVRPRIIPMEQCYWHVDSGRISEARGGASITPYGGSAASNSSSRDRFFKAACFIVNNYIENCSWSWQN